MRNLLTAAVAIFTVAAISAANAQRATMPPAYSWTGFYLGLDAGLAWDRQTVSDFACSTCNTVPASTTLSGSSLAGGIYAGYNFLIAPAWLAGLEADWSSAHFNDATTAPQVAASGGIGAPPAINGWSHDAKWVASLRGRVGITPSPVTLLFVTGGAAWTRVDYSAQDVFGPLGCATGNCGLSSFSQSKEGYVVGAGGEWAPWANNWILRLEYLYYHFNGATSSVGFQSGPPVICCNFSWGDLSIHEVRFGVAYKF